MQCAVREVAASRGNHHAEVVASLAHDMEGVVQDDGLEVVLSHLGRVQPELGEAPLARRDRDELGERTEVALRVAARSRLRMPAQELRHFKDVDGARGRGTGQVD